MEFLDTVNQYISAKKYANKGIRTKDGTLAYVTSTGVTKQFSSLEDAGSAGENCPNEFVDVDQTWQNLGFPIGSLMVTGQSCGNEGTYVRPEPPSTDFDWEFYLKNNGDLPAAGITTEQQALDHWNNFGKSEGRAPNSTIFSTMGSLGKVGYVDVDTVFHQVQPNYSTEYKAFPSRSNITGTTMADCTNPLPLVKYGEPLVLMQNNQTASLNSSALLVFGSEKINLFLRPPPGEDLTGQPVRVGDNVSITTSSSSQTSDCGWWGCKVGTINNQMQLIFNAGGDNPSLFTIVSSRKNGTLLRLSDTFTLRSIPQSNKANLDVNKSVNCTAGQPDGMPAGVYRYSGNNEMNYYPTPDVANSWNPDWGSAVDVNCSTYSFGETLKKNNAAGLKQAQSVQCNSGQEPKGGVRGGAYRYVGENTLRWYSDPLLARRWIPKFLKPRSIDCTTYNSGSRMTNKMDGNAAKELIEMPKMAYVSNGILMFGTSEAEPSVFSFQLTDYDPACKIDKLKLECNANPFCFGFVQAPSNNSWQMIGAFSSAANYKITSTLQDIYLKDANVDLYDDSCEPGPVNFIKGSIFEKYPQGNAFVNGQGTDKCKVVKAPRGSVSNDAKKAQVLVDNFPNIQYNSDPRKEMKKKTKEYKEVLQGIKKMEPSVTLEQQYTDMTVFDEQNKTALIIWSVISVSILGFVFFRMKS